MREAKEKGCHCHYSAAQARLRGGHGNSILSQQKSNGADILGRKPTNWADTGQEPVISVVLISSFLRKHLTGQSFSHTDPKL